MFRKIKSAAILLMLCCFYFTISAQLKSDSVINKSPTKDTLSKPVTDTATAKKHSPRLATFRSAVLPGWGQYYNKKYWKIPLVYAALGIPAGLFVYNIKEYKRLKTAYIYRTDTITGNDALIDPRFKNLSTESIRSYRNTFRQNADYCVLFFVIAWGLNVVDATVDAHLKGFDVSDDLSLKILPGHSNMANTTGVSFVLKFRDKKSFSFSAP